MYSPLLATKLFTPRISESYISRKTNSDRLIAGYQNGCHLTLICAPAGYGKTSLALEFLQGVEDPNAWISLDDGDNDPKSFLAYFAAALKHASIPVGDDLDALIADSVIGSPETILTLLINTTSICTDRHILVLDDYHVIRNQKIHDLMKFLLEHQPSGLHVVIISREDPPLPLARLRMKGTLSELRMDHLLFTADEIAKLFKRSTDRDIEDRIASKVASRTEGWIAGIQLVVLMLKNRREDEMDLVVSEFDGSSSYIIDYLVEEVLENEPAEIRDFLFRSSVLERMNSSLCDAVLQRNDSKEMLRQIEKKNLFLLPLDDKREWYRYHQLFADSLQNHLCLEDEKELNKRAAVWMKDSGLTREAVHYAFATKDLPFAFSIVENSVEEAFQNAQLDSYLEWMNRFPEDMIRQSELLCVRKAVVLFATGHPLEAAAYLGTLDSTFEQNASPHNKGLFLSIRAMSANTFGTDAEPLAREALQYLQPWDPIARTSTLNTLARAQYKKGHVAEALVTFKSAYESGIQLGYQFITTITLTSYSSCLHTLKRTDEALRLCLDYIEGMQRQFVKPPAYIGVLYLAMAKLYSSKHDIKEAQRLQEEGLALCRSISYDGEAALLFTDSTSKPAKDQPTPDFVDKLSDREQEILALLGGGFSNHEIAQKLFISINTTQWHITHIYEKLDVKNRTQAVLKAKQLGLF